MVADSKEERIKILAPHLSSTRTHESVGSNTRKNASWLVSPNEVGVPLFATLTIVC